MGQSLGTVERAVSPAGVVNLARESSAIQKLRGQIAGQLKQLPVTAINPSNMSKRLDPSLPAPQNPHVNAMMKRLLQG